MEEIDITQLLSYIKSKFIYIIFAISIAFCITSIYVNKIRVPEYTSTTTILLNQSGEGQTISSNDITLNKSLVTTYGEIIKSKRVLRQVIDSLDLKIDYPTLYKKVSVGSVTDTSIISVKVTDRNNEEAARIANSIAEVFTKEIVEIYNIDNVSIIDAAEVSVSTSSSSSIKIIAIGTIGGAIMALTIILIIFYFDTTIKNEADIEKITGLPVIGIVPISKEKIKYVPKTPEQRSHKDEVVMPIIAEKVVVSEPKPVVEKKQEVVSKETKSVSKNNKKKYYYK